MKNRILKGLLLGSMILGVSSGYSMNYVSGQLQGNRSLRPRPSNSALVNENKLPPSSAPVSENKLPPSSAPVSENKLPPSSAPVSENKLPPSSAPVSEDKLPPSSAPVNANNLQSAGNLVGKESTDSARITVPASSVSAVNVVAKPKTTVAAQVQNLKSKQARTVLIDEDYLINSIKAFQQRAVMLRNLDRTAFDEQNGTVLSEKVVNGMTVRALLEMNLKVFCGVLSGGLTQQDLGLLFCTLNKMGMSGVVSKMAGVKEELQKIKNEISVLNNTIGERDGEISLLRTQLAQAMQAQEQNVVMIGGGNAGNDDFVDDLRDEGENNNAGDGENNNVNPKGNVLNPPVEVEGAPNIPAAEDENNNVNPKGNVLNPPVEVEDVANIPAAEDENNVNGNVNLEDINI